MSKVITLFMWGYQEHFRRDVCRLLRSALEQLGVVGVEPKAFAVGTRRPDVLSNHPICIEPEDGPWPLRAFDGLLEAVEEIYRTHPDQKTLYGDSPSMQDKPERIRRDSVRLAVLSALKPLETDWSVVYFAGSARIIGDYYVVPVVQLPVTLFKTFPPLLEPVGDGQFEGYPSLLHACVAGVLAEASAELERGDPGRFFGQRMRNADEVVRTAASSFMKSPGLAIRDESFYHDLFDQFNMVSSMMYEGAKGRGLMLLAKPDDDDIEMILRFKVPVPFLQPRWARKIMQMASSEVALIASCESIFGLGRVRDGYDWSKQRIFEVEFLDHYHWELRCGGQPLLRSQYAAPSLSQPSLSKDRFSDTYMRLFPGADKGCELAWSLLNAAASIKHGSMFVVAEDAAQEAARLEQQGTNVNPVQMNPELYGRVSRIDGTILLDPDGVCYAVGVILDGPSVPECTPSRGSRYNSGVRYIAGDARRLAVVVSDDRTVDVLPILRPRIRRGQLEAAVAALEGATLENYHQPRTWLDGHRFYLNQDQCDRVNAALDRIEQLPTQVGQIVILTQRLTPHPKMDDSYILAE